MYFVGDKFFESMSDAMNCCSSGPLESVVTDENGTVLMRHQELPIEDIFGLMIAKTFLKVQRCSIGLEDY